MNSSKQKELISQNYSRAYTRVKQSLLSFLRARLDDPSIAEDIVHDAFVKALVHDPETPINNVDAWLKRIVRNALVDYYRAKHRDSFVSELETTIELLDDSVDAARTDIEIHHLFAQFLRPFVDCMPPKYAQVLISKEYEDKSIKEIAAQLELSESAIKSRLSRGRKLLQEQLLLCCEIELDAGIVKDFTPRTTNRLFK